MYGLEVILLIALTAASAFASSTEIAYFSLPASRVKSFRSSLNIHKRQVARILSQPKDLLVMIFMLNTIVNVLLQNTASSLFSEGNWWLKVGFPLFLVLIFGELVPKYISLLHNETLATSYAPTVGFLQRIFTPLQYLITWVSSFFSRLIFFFLKLETPLTKEELEHILESSEGKGLLHREEAELILGVLSLDDKQIKELMQPRSSMPFYDIHEPLSKLIYLFSEENLPDVYVFDMPEEKILGVISIRDFFIEREKLEQGEDLKPVLKKPLFIPETTRANLVLDKLRTQNIPSALIIDEYGRASGLIYQQELVSFIVKSKKAQKEAPEGYSRVSKDAIIADGTLPLSEVEELFGISLETLYHVVTIGGLLTERLGTIPKSGTTWQEQGLFFRILSSDQTHIRKVYIQKKGAIR